MSPSVYTYMRVCSNLPEGVLFGDTDCGPEDKASG
jgi:hypothetical protein